MIFLRYRDFKIRCRIGTRVKSSTKFVMKTAMYSTYTIKAGSSVDRVDTDLGSPFGRCSRRSVRSRITDLNYTMFININYISYIQYIATKVL